MKHWLCILSLLAAVQITLGQTSRDFLPPFNFRIDSTTLLATWEAPKIVLLDEDFEGQEFPPPGWEASSQGSGWMQTNDPDFSFWHFPVPESNFALTNDDLIYSNNGSLDYLISPALDLTVADSFYMVFDSYFDGGYGELAFIEYSLDSGNTWNLLYQVDASLDWETVRVDLSSFSGTDGESNILISFHASDNGYFASGWAVDNIFIGSDDIQAEVVYYKIFLDSLFIGQVTENQYQYGYKYGITHTCSILARYLEGISDTVRQTVKSSCLPKPDSLSGSAPDDAAILTWSPPQVSYEGPASEQNRDVGDVLIVLDTPPPINSCYGICDDGEFLWVTDPTISNDKIYKIEYDGVNTGQTITVNLGQAWIGDMVSDGFFLYACLIGGPNAIVEVYIPTGQIIRTITGDFSIAPQYGLAADFENDEFYIGGWNDNRIWRTDFNGVTIDSHAFNNVSGLAFVPVGGPEEEGSLWVMVKAANSVVTEIDPNNNWIIYDSFPIPGGQPNSGAGIETGRGPYIANTLWFCNQVNNTIYLCDLDEPCCGIPGTIPDNLLGFNLCKNGDYLDYIEYTTPESCGYIDTVSWGEYYEGSVLKYEITAIYDMTPYGFPGETGESPPDGPAELFIPIYWLELNFLEDWSAGNFDDNAWFVTDSNWTVSQDIGNEAPCAVFMPDALMNNYEATLESYHFLELSTNEIILEYDVALSSLNPTGNEKLLVQVFDNTNYTWNTVRTITNIDGSFDWRKDSLNIAGAFNPGRLRIRFNATGENSSDINYWAVDNIALTRICPAPDSIEVALMPPSEDSVFVAWEEPTPPISEWKQWDDGVHYGGIGFGTGKETWTGIAAHWTPDLLMELKGAVLTKIGFIPADLRAFFKIAVWIGEDPTPVYIQATGNLVLNEYNIIQLEEPLNIDITQDLYVGYLLSTYTGYPISIDDGPAIDGYGNMISTGVPTHWVTLLQMNGDLNYNWNIKAWFERDGVQYESFYNLFRSIDGSEPELIAETMDNEFTDPISIDSGFYCYKVKALYYNGCESQYSPEACVLLTETPSIDQEQKEIVNVYPNPATDVLFIESSERLESVCVFDSRGGMVEQWKGGKVVWWYGGKVEIPVGGLAPGLYLVRVEAKNLVINRKIIIK